MLDELNKNLFLAINKLQFSHSAVKTIAVFFAEYVVFLFLLVLVVLWFYKRDEKIRQAVLIAGYCAVLGIILNFVISRIYYQPRPFVLKLGHLLVEHKADASFPSDHTTFMLCIAAGLMFYSRAFLIGLFFFVFGLLSGFARIVCGLHFPFDIIGSVIITFIVVFCIYFFKSWITKINEMIIGIWQNIENK
ncbi:MAG TPA: phosphatase PAP2 family protein, partial [bacterium]|nr:phosphatase PAP2 family protein [bacterium]